MNNNNTIPSKPAVSRRDFLKSTSLAVGAAAVSFPAVLSAQDKQPMNAVIIGMGGRGGGAGKNFLDACKIVGVEGKIVATADIFPEQAARGKQNFQVPEERCFSGFDCHMKALAVPGVNYAIIATPPGFKPPQFKAAVEAGKHVFIEKPVSVDGPGSRIMYAAGELAKQKGLKVAAGTQRRHQAGYIDTIKHIQDGMIGDIVSLRAYWVNGGPIWHRGDNGATAIEKQIRNWYHFIWLSGDHICEQHVHNIDVCNWVMNDHPVKAWGMGARQQLGSKPGEIWDNFAVEFEYPGGVRMASYCGQVKRSWSSVSEFVVGTKGTSNPGGSISVKGGDRWRASLKLESGDAYVQEHVDLIKAILNNTELNETKNVTDSTLTAIMGREAAYSGGAVEWDAILESPFQYGPELLYTDAAKMQYGDFRTLVPPMPSKHDVLKNPPVVQTA
ncbi:MAG: Gfo/Idh/MocA family oxidoreductase [Verrucomicrobia bacterium]|nr:Gfo/Idh/MocA family oxidoreductase [Verrucomicrobiota bacterium]